MTFLVLAVLAACPIYLVTLPDRSPVWFWALFVGYIAAAFPLGLAAVASQRRGDSGESGRSDWRLRDIGPMAGPLPAAPAFGSPAAAQNWYEWNCHGLAFPHMSAVVMLMIWGVLLAVGRQNSLMLPPIFGLLLVLPVLLGRRRRAWAWDGSSRSGSRIKAS